MSMQEEKKTEINEICVLSDVELDEVSGGADVTAGWSQKEGFSVKVTFHF